MNKNKQKTQRRNKVRRRIRSKIRGTSERPRLSIYKSNKHVYAQLVDDRSGHTLAFSSTQKEEIAKEMDEKTRTEGARLVGEHLAEIAKEKGIEKAVFDRSGYRYHGVIQVLADAAREAGLDF